MKSKKNKDNLLNLQQEEIESQALNIGPIEINEEVKAESEEPVLETKEDSVEEQKVKEVKEPKKEKAHLTRKNLIFIACTILFLLVQGFCLICLDESSGFMKKNNPISALSKAFGLAVFESIPLTLYIIFFLNLFYLLLTISVLLFEVRMAKFYKKRAWDAKHWVLYTSTVGIYLVLSLSVTILLQLPFSLEKFNLVALMMGSSFILAFIIYAIIALILASFLVIYVNMRNIDKPYRFFGRASRLDEEIETLTSEKEKTKEVLESDISKSLDYAQGIGGTFSASGISGTAVASGSGNNDTPAFKDRERVFPGLCLIDKLNEFEATPIISDTVSLTELTEGFWNYLGSKELYFDIDTIRQFIAALGTTRLIILEGLSGTGKSSLPRLLGDYLKCGSFFAPVQATWRDRSALLGYYNDFSRMFNETDFLKKLYEASYNTDKLNLMVLDELNLSRIEYYFADFLSILEYPSEEWKLTLMQLPYDFETPNHLQEGKLRIPTNTYFIGTANKDDSTYTITDKVYDRAITINFDDRNEPFEVKGEIDPISISSDYLQSLFAEAKNNKENHLDKHELEKFLKVVNFIYDTFDITFGNRILNQIEDFVPIFVACGGTKEAALDFLLTRKVIYKIEGRFEDYIKVGLMDLKELINKEYHDKFKLTLKTIDKMLKRM